MALFLLSAIPYPDPDKKLEFAVGGEAVDPADLPAGCSFHPRCPHAKPGLCDVRGKPPALREIVPGRYVSCVCVEEIEEELP